MKKPILLLTLFIAFSSIAQEMTLKKGAIIERVSVNDSIQESFALFLPSTFEMTKDWPVVFVYDMKGRGKQVLSMMVTAAETNGYILAASNNVNDSLPLTKNILISERMFSTVFNMLPVKKQRVYTAGFAGGARVASVIPTFIRQVKGVINCGSAIANIELLSNKNYVHFIGIVGNEDYNYNEMIQTKKALDLKKCPNQLLVFNGGHKWPSQQYISMAMLYLDLIAMRNGVIPVDNLSIERTYKENLTKVNNLVSDGNPVLAYRKMKDLFEVYKGLKNLDSLKENRKVLRRSPNFKRRNRSHTTFFTKELFKKDDYDYYLEEDLLTYNYNNLGWWKYQIEELKKNQKSANRLERDMGLRLEGYLNALIDDNIDIVKLGESLNEEALNLLWMLKTITNPDEFSNYLEIISLNAKVEDFGTALFYVEELLKRGFTNVDQLYTLKNTALLRITPEFNKLVAKYLKESRYEIIEE